MEGNHYDAKRISATWRALVLSLTIATLWGAFEGETLAREGTPSTKNLVMVINYPYQITGTAKTRIHTVFFKPDFSPAVGAEVTVNGKKVGVADENGTCIFDYVPGENQGHTLVATLEEKGTTWKVTKGFASNARTASFRSDQLFVYTDRGVYNPGDDILVRMLAWELLGDYTALADKEVKLLLQDGAGKVFAGQELKTNEYGIAATRLPLSENMPEGDYELVVLYNQARETARLRVKRFVPPVMEIDHDIKRFLTPAQKELPITAKLTFFAGGIPMDGKLSLTVLSNTGAKILAKAFAEAQPGSFELKLVAGDLDAIRSKTAAEQPFKMVMEATDEFGRKSEVTRDVVYTERPYRAVLEFDKDDYPPGETVKLHAKVVDLDGKPARNIPLVCTVQEFKVVAKATTDANGVAEFSFAMGKSPGTAVVTSPVMGVPLAQKAVRLNRPKPMTSKASEPPQKQGVQTHISVTFDKRYRPVEKVVHVDFTDLSGALVMSTTIPVTKEGDGYRAAGTVTAKTWGTMLANLYVCAVETKKVKEGGKLSLSNVGFITEGQHVTLHPDADAHIVIEGLKPRVKPGTKLEVTVSVKTPSGGDAALGAMMVDNAVVSLLDPLEVTPVDHFYNPQRKVISTGGAGVLTWPVVDRNWGNPWRDIAYTDWGWKAPGGLVDDARDGAKALMGGEGGMGGGAGALGGVGSGAASYGVGGVALGAKKEAPKKKGLLKMLAAKPAADATLADEDASPMEMEMAEEAMDDGIADGEMGRRRSRGQGKAPAKPRQITIRTRFPETALWEPLLATKGGAKKLAIQFPDAITVQRLTLIASDKTGGLGVLHEEVEVRQDLYVQADLPAVLTLGDEVTVVAVVRNLSGKDAELTVVPTASGLHLPRDAARTIAVKDGESVPVEWRVKADFVGEVEFAASAENESVRDEERKKTRVLPAGEPVRTESRGAVAAGQPFAATVKVDGDAVYSAAFLNVSFPNVIPAIQAWQALAEVPMAFVGVTGVASRAILDAALLSHARDTDLPKEQRKALEERLRRAAAELLAAQNDDGSWGWFYLADASSPGGYVVSVYLSAYALRALVEVAEADVLVDKAAIRKGIDFLYESRNDEGLWSPTAYFWEVNAPETDWGLSGDLFETLVRAHVVMGLAPEKPMLALRSKFDAFLEKRPGDPGAVAPALGALHRWAAWQKDRKLDGKVEEWLRYLLTLKRDGYWEPHWYHAYGGMVELNARILELLRSVNKPENAAVEYEIVAWLLSTREAWGAWHNEIGTANAVRALLAAGAGARAEKASTVTVRVNGEAVRTVAIRPDDPFLSAASLRFVELTRFLKAGVNEVEVVYDGNLQAPVTLELQQWGVADVAAEPAEGGRLRVERKAPESASVGAPLEVSLWVTAGGAVPHVEVIDAIPSPTAVDRTSLDKLVKEGVIQGYRVEDGQVALFLARLDREATITYRLLAVAEGTGLHRGTRVSARFHPQFGVGRAVGGVLRVN